MTFTHMGDPWPPTVVRRQYEAVLEKVWSIRLFQYIYYIILIHTVIFVSDSEG